MSRGWTILGAMGLAAVNLACGALTGLTLYRIPQDGMYPTYPANAMFILDASVCPTLADVQRGDVIIFDHTWTDGVNYDFIWRVVGLPGEQIEVRGHLVTVDGVAATVVEERVDGEFRIGTEEIQGESWPIAWPVVVDPNPADSVNGGGLVAADALFVLGDNRYNAADSRTMGSIPWSEVRGCVQRPD